MFFENLLNVENDLLNNILLCAIIVLIILNYYSDYLRQIYYLSKVPGPPGIPLIGNLFSFLGSTKDMTQIGLQFIQTYSPIFKVWVGPLPIVVVTGPEAAQVVLTSPQCLEKADLFKKLGSPVIGEAILISEVSKWKHNRNIVLRGFSPNLIKIYHKVFVEKSNILSTVLERELNSKNSFDIFEYVSRAALDSICTSAMGLDMNAQQNESLTYFNAVQSVFHNVFERGFNIWKHPDCIYYLLNESKEFKNNIQVIQNLATQVINEKRMKKNNKALNNDDMDMKEEQNPHKKPLLEFLIDITDNNSTFTDEQLRNEINLLIMAGYETSSNALSYNLLCLAAHKDIQNKVYNELHQVFGDSDRPIEVSDLAELHYMDLVLKESMRLFPTIPITLRQIKDDIKIDNMTIPRGLNCVICFFQIHRNEKVWENPLKFDPDRFLPENIKQRHPYAYLPFSAGSRNCIGMRYSTTFMKTVLTTLLRKYEFHTNLKLDELTFCCELSLKIVGGHQVFITPRRKC